jgi:sRNA-binding protein
MKKIFFGLTLIALPVSTVFAQSNINLRSASTQTSGVLSPKIQQNLIGEVSSVDAAGGKIVVSTETKTSVTVPFNDKTAFRRVAPGQTSLANAEQIKVTDIQIGDRVLIPGGVAADQAPVRQIVVMARAAINSQRDEEQRKRRERTVAGRITAVNADKKEIVIQARGGRNSGTDALTIDASGNVKMLRYAPDSLKLSDAVAGSFTDLRVGDQIRVIGDRNAEGTRVAAEEIFSGSVTRLVGSVSEINAARGEIVVKNSRTGELTTIAMGKNTTLRRITPEVAENLKQRMERRRDRRNQRDSGDSNNQQTQAERRRAREERRSQNNNGQQANRNPRQMFEDLPAITVGDLKKGDAVLITGTGANSRLTAVSVISGDSDLQEILQRTQGGRGGNMSPGLPGNVSGGNAPGGNNDDEP